MVRVLRVLGHVLSAPCGLMGNACVVRTGASADTAGHRASCGESSLEAGIPPAY